MNNLHNSFQSAYKAHHSTETVLLRLKNDIQCDLSKNRKTAVVLLDLSAAFDTIDKSLLLDSLKHWFGIDGLAFDWFSSYLSDHLQCVRVGKSFSSDKEVICGVPQGSVLGPLLCSLYTSPLSIFISRHPTINHLLYADDTQLYMSLSPISAAVSLSEMSDCLQEISK